MPYTLPTATTMKTRFPDLASVADATITAFITEAARSVDTTWLEADYTLAISFLAAHYMAREGILGPGSANAPASGPLTSKKLGSASYTWATPTEQGSAYETELRSTAYGLRFLELRRVNVPGAVTVSRDAQIS